MFEEICVLRNIQFLLVIVYKTTELHFSEEVLISRFYITLKEFMWTKLTSLTVAAAESAV